MLQVVTVPELSPSSPILPDIQALVVWPAEMPLVIPLFPLMTGLKVIVSGAIGYDAMVPLFDICR